MSEIREGSYGLGGVLSQEGIEQTHQFLPNTQALHPDTKYQVYREFKPRTGKVEITVFYREPGKDKMRIDAEFDEGTFVEDLGPKTIRITYWGSATRGIV